MSFTCLHRLWLGYLITLGLGISVQASPAKAGEVVLAAAASLKDALEVLKPKIEKSLPGTHISITTGASGTLVQQIVQGAPIDIFISAAVKPMDLLAQDKRLLEGSRQTLLTNDIVLIVPKTNRLGLETIPQLTQSQVKRLAIGEPRSVPAGEYAVQVMRSLGLEKALESKFVLAKDVRQVLSYVERGEVDAGFVYSSDLKAKNAASVKVIASAPKYSHQPILYEMAIVKAGRNRTLDSKSLEIKRVADILAGAEAAKVWTDFGFILPGAKTAKEGSVRAPL